MSKANMNPESKVGQLIMYPSHRLNTYIIGIIIKEVECYDGETGYRISWCDDTASTEAAYNVESYLSNVNTYCKYRRKPYG